jgi:hypothetical protein
MAELMKHGALLPRDQQHYQANRLVGSLDQHGSKPIHSETLSDRILFFSFF